MKKLTLIFFALAAAIAPCSALAAVELAGLFSDGMVIQRQVPVPVWGTAEAGAEITVVLGGQSKKTVSDGEGRWKVELDPFEANDKGMDLRIIASTELIVRNVLVGDVWILTGSPSLLTAPKHVSPKVEGEPLRILKLPFRTAKLPMSDIPPAKWEVLGEATDSAFAVQFAKAYSQCEKRVPVGVITAVSETPNSGGLTFSGDLIEAWAPENVLSALPWNDDLMKILSVERLLGAAKTHFEQKLAAWKAKNGHLETPKDEKEYDVWFYEKLAAVKEDNAPPAMPGIDKIQAPSTVWNGLLAPLTQTPVRGILFVPGIGNMGNPGAVGRIAEGMIAEWRKEWKNEKLPVLCLGPWPHGAGDETYVAGSELANAYRMVATLPHAALIPFADLYDTTNRSRVPDLARLAKRVAPIAAELGAGKPVAVAPVITAATPSGNSMVLSVDNPALLPAEGTAITGFNLYSPNTHWVWATGTTRNGSIVVEHPKVPAPEAVRYDWRKHSKYPPTLTGPTGVPSPAFRSDDQINCRGMIPNGNIQMALRYPLPEKPVEAIDIYPVEDPTLPWVMTIGDSIHNGYRFEVRAMLEGVANVVPLTTPQGSRGALGQPRPLWGIKKDELALLHINHGLHGDCKEPPDQYEALLEKYLLELQATVGTGKIIWVATTPVPSKKPGESLDPKANPDIIRINEVARKLTAKHGMGFNDLYSVITPQVDKLTISKGNVHFNSEGCQLLAKAVAEAIRNNLTAKK